MSFTKRTPQERLRARQQAAARRAYLLNRLRTEATFACFSYLGSCDKPLTKAENDYISRIIAELNEGAPRIDPRQISALRPEEARRAIRSWLAAASPKLSERRRLFVSLREFALCDGPTSTEEDSVLSELSLLLRLHRQPSRSATQRGATLKDRAAKRKTGGSTSESTQATHEPLASLWCYDLLGCSPLDSDETIKRSYRRLALKLHPDKHATHPEATHSHVQAFQQLQEAYHEVLRLRGRGKPQRHSRSKA